MQQRQHDVAAAEHQRARAVEATEPQHRRPAGGEQRQSQQQGGEKSQAGDADEARDRHAQGAGLHRAAVTTLVATACEQSGGSAETDRGDLCRCGRCQQDQRGGDGGDGAACQVGTQGGRHAAHRLRHDRDGGQLQSVQQPGTGGGRIDPRHAERERQHQQRGGQGEADPGGQAAGIAAAQQAERESGLAGSRTGQELAQADDVRELPLVEPAAPLDELGAEITEMRDRAAEAAQAQPGEGDQHLQDRRKPAGR